MDVRYAKDTAITISLLYGRELNKSALSNSADGIARGTEVTREVKCNDFNINQSLSQLLVYLLRYNLPDSNHSTN